LSLSKPVLVVLLLVAAGCGTATPHEQADPVGKVALGAICPGAHQVYDALVASNPDSQTQFVVHLEDLRKVGDAQARAALDPVITAAKSLAAAGRGPNFSSAQDAMYQAVVGLDARCKDAGAFILH